MKLDDSQNNPNTRSSTFWPWVILALWFLWLAALIFMGRAEWKPRAEHLPEDELPSKINQRDTNARSTE